MKESIVIFNSNIEMLFRKNKRIKVILQFIDMYVNRFEKQGFIKVED